MRVCVISVFADASSATERAILKSATNVWRALRLHLSMPIWMQLYSLLLAQAGSLSVLVVHKLSEGLMRSMRAASSLSARPTSYGQHGTTVMRAGLHCSMVSKLTR